MVAGIITEIISYYLTSIGQANFAIYNIFNLVRGMLFAFYFFRVTLENRWKLLGVIVGTATIIEWALAPNQFVNISAGVTNVVILLGIFYIFSGIAQNHLDSSHYWLLGVIMLEQLGSFIYLMLSTWINDMTLLREVATIWVILNAVCNIAYAIALWTTLNYSFQHR